MERVGQRTHRAGERGRPGESRIDGSTGTTMRTAGTPGEMEGEDAAVTRIGDRR